MNYEDSLEVSNRVLQLYYVKEIKFEFLPHRIPIISVFYLYFYATSHASWFYSKRIKMDHAFIVAEDPEAANQTKAVLDGAGAELETRNYHLL